MSDTTTTNIPTTDPALLAAQAKAGQAGVDAYNAAIAKLQTERSTAVNSAMTSAAARGLAGPDAGGDVGRMYDSRISGLQQALGGFQGDAAARAGRLSDYNAAVTSARSLIPGQVAIATAPIKAQGEFDVWKIGAQGRSAVDEIEAKRRLAEAQMEAAKLAAASRGGGGGGRGGGGGGAKLTGEKLQSTLVAGAQDRMNQIGADTVAHANAAPHGSDVANANAGANAAGQAAAYFNQNGATPATSTSKGKTNPISAAIARLLAPLQSAIAQQAQLSAPTSRVTRPPAAAPMQSTQGMPSPQNPLGASAGMPGMYVPGGSGGVRQAQVPTSAPSQQLTAGATALQQLIAQLSGVGRGRSYPTANIRSGGGMSPADSAALQQQLALIAPGRQGPVPAGPLNPRQAATAAFQKLLPGYTDIPSYKNYAGESSGSREGILQGLDRDQANPQYLEDNMALTGQDLINAGQADEPSVLTALGRGSTYKPGMTAEELADAQAGNPAREAAAEKVSDQQYQDQTRQDTLDKAAAAENEKNLEAGYNQEFADAAGGLQLSDVQGTTAAKLAAIRDPQYAKWVAEAAKQNWRTQAQQDTWLRKINDLMIRRIIAKQYG